MKKSAFNNGISEIFCEPDKKPEGYVLGRPPTINVGRTYSEEKIQKMRNAKLGKPAGNRGKIFITDGYENRYISASEQIPDGWKRGTTRRRSSDK